MTANASVWSKTIIEIPVTEINRRLLEVIPATLAWGTLLGLTLLAFVVPFWIAIFVIVFDLYALIRAGYMSVYLLVGYLRLRRDKRINWLERAQGVSSNLENYREKITRRLRHLKGSANKNDRLIARELTRHRREVTKLIEEAVVIPDWSKINHAIILSTYDESLTVLRASLTSLTKTNFPKEQLHVVVGFEERAGSQARERAAKLRREFGKSFQTFITSFHPDGLPNEARVKSANANWGIKALEKKLAEQSISRDNVLVSNFDSDTVVSPSYFAYLTYAFLTQPDRYRCSYQPLPLYNNNIWDAPAFSRVIAAGSTFWQMIESTRPERLVTFSSHSMTLKALQEVGYWDGAIISEDSRIFWQCLLHYNGDYRTVPLYTSVSMDAALAPSWWQTLVNQYKQKRRWAWGIENFPYLAQGFQNNSAISARTKFIYIFRTLEGHFSWATVPIIIAGLGWIPIFFGDPAFHATVLSYSLPFVARTLMTIAMGGLLISAALTLLLLPPRPEHVSSSKYVSLLLQWALVPIIATILSAIPALDAETRLALGRDLQFNVMQKTRKSQ
ncbi:glycosyltransferase family 2 protein [Patescibacteria group bacterium]|nr:glycosyltransferase family 2 protein [Patescibacteria group bacterium]